MKKNIKSFLIFISLILIMNCQKRKQINKISNCCPKVIQNIDIPLNLKYKKYYYKFNLKLNPIDKIVIDYNYKKTILQRKLKCEDYCKHRIIFQNKTKIQSFLSELKFNRYTNRAPEITKLIPNIEIFLIKENKIKFWILLYNFNRLDWRYQFVMLFQKNPDKRDFFIGASNNLLKKLSELELKSNFHDKKYFKKNSFSFWD